MNWINLIFSSLITGVGLYIFIKNINGQKFSKISIIIFIILTSLIYFINKICFEVLTKNILNNIYDFTT